MTEGDALPKANDLRTDSATRDEILALNDDDLLAFWLAANKEYNRLVWGGSEEFLHNDVRVARRVAWSQREIDDRRGTLSSDVATPGLDA